MEGSMACVCIIRGAATSISLLPKSNSKDHYYYNCNYNYAPIILARQFKRLSSSSSSSSSSFRVNCRGRDDDDDSITSMSMAAAYTILGVEPDCSAAQLKSAFRAKVKEFHPDVRSNQYNSDLMIRRVIQAYEVTVVHLVIVEAEFHSGRGDNNEDSLTFVLIYNDPFDNPECEAFDIFVNEVLCVGKGCPYSCVKQAPHAFTFSSLGTARATSQGHDEDYQVQLAVGRCPRSCIHYVTPSQRIILEELLDSILDAPYDASAEADLLYSLIVKAKYENNRYQKQKQPPRTSTEHVDWY